MESVVTLRIGSASKKSGGFFLVCIWIMLLSF